MLIHRGNLIVQTALRITQMLLFGLLSFLQYLMQMIVYNLLFTLLFSSLVILQCFIFLPGISGLALHGFNILRSWLVENTSSAFWMGVVIHMRVIYHAVHPRCAIKMQHSSYFCSVGATSVLRYSLNHTEMVSR